MGKKKGGDSYLNNMVDSIFGNTQSQSAGAKSSKKGGKHKGGNSPLNNFIDSALNIFSGSTSKESAPTVGGKGRKARKQGGDAQMNKQESFVDMNKQESFADISQIQAKLPFEGGKGRKARKQGGDAQMNKQESFADMNINSIAQLKGGKGKKAKKQGGDGCANKQESFTNISQIQPKLSFEGGKGKKAKRTGGNGETTGMNEMYNDENIFEGVNMETEPIAFNTNSNLPAYTNTSPAPMLGGKAKQNKKKGGVLLELSPFLASLITLGARIAADPKLSKSGKIAKVSNSSKSQKNSKKSVGGDGDMLGEMLESPLTKEYSSYPFVGNLATEAEASSGGAKKRARKARGGTMQEAKELLPTHMQ